MCKPLSAIHNIAIVCEFGCVGFSFQRPAEKFQPNTGWERITKSKKINPKPAKQKKGWQATEYLFYHHAMQTRIPHTALPIGISHIAKISRNLNTPIPPPINLNITMENI